MPKTNGSNPPIITTILICFVSSTCSFLLHFVYPVINLATNMEVIRFANRGKIRHIFAIQKGFYMIRVLFCCQGSTQ